MEEDLPAKLMWLYATIWDGSTSGGKYKVNCRFSPFTAEFTNLVVNPIKQFPSCSTYCSDVEEEVAAADYTVMTARKSTIWFYSFYYDVKRYSVPLFDCDVAPEEEERFKDTGHLKFRDSHRTRLNRKSSDSSSRVPLDEDDGVEEFK